MLDPRSKAARELADKYRELLRKGLDTSNAPPEVQEAHLAMLQNAQAVYWEHAKEVRDMKKLAKQAARRKQPPQK